MTRWTRDANAAASHRRLLPVLIGLGAVALAVTTVLVRPDAPGHGRAATTTAAPTTPAVPSSSVPPRATPSPPSATTVRAEGDPGHEARAARHGQGAHACPSVDVPSVAAGTLLSRCASNGTTVYTLVLPDTRLDGALWSLTVQSKNSTPVRPAAILPVLVDGVAATFG